MASAPLIPSPASTVVLVREACEQRRRSQLEVLLLLRNRKLSFEGGAWVFPGGKVDAGDYPENAHTMPEEKAMYLAARNAAVRETHEEAGLRIAPGELIHIAHWTTPHGLSRRFATWFFLCPLYSYEDIVVDDEEILDYRWVTPRTALALHAGGQMRLPGPTSHTLRSIASYGCLCLQRLCLEMKEADIHVFPEGSEYYRPVNS